MSTATLTKKIRNASTPMFTLFAEEEAQTQLDTDRELRDAYLGKLSDG